MQVIISSDLRLTCHKMTGIEKIASPYGFGQPSDTPDEFGQLISYNTLMDVGYASYLQNWTFPEDDERYGMSTLQEMADWNDAHNATTGALGNGTIWKNTVSKIVVKATGRSLAGGINEVLLFQSPFQRV